MRKHNEHKRERTNNEQKEETKQLSTKHTKTTKQTEIQTKKYARSNSARGLFKRIGFGYFFVPAA